MNLGRSCIFVMMSNLIATLISLIECLITFTKLINKDAYRYILESLLYWELAFTFQ